MVYTKQASAVPCSNLILTSKPLIFGVPSDDDTIGVKWEEIDILIFDGRRPYRKQGRFIPVFSMQPSPGNGLKSKAFLHASIIPLRRQQPIQVSQLCRSLTSFVILFYEQVDNHPIPLHAEALLRANATLSIPFITPGAHQPDRPLNDKGKNPGPETLQLVFKYICPADAPVREHSQTGRYTL